MACQIKRNTKGIIVDVLDPSGNSSKLFREIHGTLFLADVDTSLKIFSNAYSSKIQEMFDGKEPSLIFKANNTQYDNLEELILNEINGEISLGFVNPKTEEFIEIGSVNNKGEKAANLTDLVKQGYLSAERVLSEDGTTRFQGKGEFATTKQWTAAVAIEELKKTLGTGQYERFADGTFTAKYNENYTEVVGIDGETLIVEKHKVPEMVKEGKIKDVVPAMVEYIQEFENPRAMYKEQPKAQKINTDEKGLKTALMNYLKGVGYTTTTLENYRKNYNTKFGKDPDIKALADIANNVIAGDFSDLDNLSEEVAHIAIEMYSDQNSIAGALASVHTTPEYAQYYDQYKDKYSKYYSGIELEDQVRKEILGKALKRTIQEKFSTVNKPASELSIIGKLKQIWEAVRNVIQSRLTVHHAKSIEILNSRIANSIFDNSTEDFQADVSENKNFFYNLMSDPNKSIEKELRVAKRGIEDLFRVALKEAIPNQSALENLVETEDEYNMVSAINTVVGIAAHQMNILKINVQEAAEKEEPLSMKDAARYQVLKENLIPSMNNIKAALTKVKFNEENKKLVANIVKSADEVVVDLSVVEPLMNADNDRIVEQTIEKILSRVDLSEKDKEEVRAKVEGGTNDLTWLSTRFGLASHSKNPVMQLLGSVVTNITTKVSRKFNNRLNKELNDITEKGQEKYQKDIIKDNTFFFMAPINETKYQEDLKNQQAKVIAEILDKPLKEIIESREKISDREILGTIENHKNFREKVKEWKDSEGTERRNTEQYYTDRDARFDKANTSAETRNYISTKNIAKYERLKKYANPDGTIDASKQTTSEKVQDDAERKAHSAAKSPVDSVGTIKPGLRIVNPAELTIEDRAELTFEVEPDFVGEIVMKDSETNLEDLSLDSRRALDLFNLDMLYRQESADKTKEGKPLQQFVDKIKGIEEEGSAFDWALNNASINLSSEYYDNLGTPVVFNDVAQEYINTIENINDKVTKQDLLDELISLQRSRKAILKQNKYANSAVETDVHHMTTLTRDRLIELDSDIADTRSAMNLPFEVTEEVSQPSGESALNEDYTKMHTESGLTEYDFALEHMTDKNSVKVKTFALQIDTIIRGKRSRVKQIYDDFLQEMVSSGELAGLSRKDAVELLKNEYAKRHVVSYFKRFQPTGYTQALEKLKSGEVKISDLIENKEELLKNNPEFEFIEITPDYSWSEDLSNTDYLNPNFKLGLANRPRLDKYLDDEFFTKYGISKQQYLDAEEDNLENLTATQNKEEFEFLKRMVKLNEESIELLGETGKVSKYQRPQISKEGFEKRAYGFNKNSSVKDNIKDTFSDMVSSKVDEKEYGETVEGLDPSDVNVKVIPKYFQNKLDKASLITENTLQSVMLNYQGALKYRERVDAEREIKALEYKISQQSFTNRGSSNLKSRILKKGSVSNYYEKAQEMTDYHLYGIKQNRQLKTEIFGKEVDLTQVFSKFTGHVAKVNLAINPIVDVTSATTGIYNNILDTFSEDYYSKEAAAKATVEANKQLFSSMNETGGLNKTSKFVHLANFYQVIDSTERLENSASNWATRAAGNARFGISKMANMTVTPKNIFAVLYDHKFVDGRFKSFNDFYRAAKIKDKSTTKKEIRASWKKITETLYDNIEVDPKKGVMMSQSFKDKFEDPQQEFDDLQLELTRKIAQINQNVDSIIGEADRTMAQRDIMTSALMLHKSWMITNITKRWKSKHFNISTGQIEEGNYNTAIRTLIQRIKSVATGNGFRLELEEFEERGNRRTRQEVLAVIILLLLTKALLLADDDDDSWGEDFAQLIMLRTTSEAFSASPVGYLGTATDIYEDPLIQARFIGNYYKAITEGDVGALGKNTLLKRRNLIEDISGQVDAYRHFNTGTLPFIGE